MLYGRISKHLHEHRHGFITFVYQKGLIDEMSALTKVALYQHSLKAANQGSCVRVECTVHYGPPYHKHPYLLLTLWYMAVFKVAEVDNAALQWTTLCVCGGNFEHYISVNWWLFLKLVMLNNWKLFEKTVSYQLTCRLWHILPALLVKCHFEIVYVCI